MSSLLKDFGFISIHQKGNILILKLAGGTKKQSVFNPEFINQFNDALDYCEQTTGEKVLIITGTGRFFSAGLDLKYIAQNPTKNGFEVTRGLASILSRVLIFGLPTIAAINGHAFGGGFYLSLCCDYRLMNNNCNDGRLCLAEIKHGMGFPIGYTDLLLQKLLPNVLRTSTLTGKQYTVKESLNNNIIDEIIYDCDNNHIFITKCIQYVNQNGLINFAKNRQNNTRLKYDLYYKIYDNFRRVVDGKWSTTQSKL